MADAKDVSGDATRLSRAASRAPPPPTPQIEAVVLQMVLYFDIFHHPLTTGELTRLVAPGQAGAVESACAGLAASGRLRRQGRFCFVPGEHATVARRRRRAAHAERAWPKARAAAAALARLPWVEGLMVTGSLSKNSMTADGDVDFLVLVAPGRVWTLKSLLQVLRRPLPHPIHELLCTNYLLSTDQLAIDDRNLYTAIELATAVPVFGRDACVALLRANGWAERWVPGLSWAVERAGRLPPSAPLRAAPTSAVGDRVERAALRAWDTYWNRKYAWLDAADRAQRFKRRPGVATNHLHDFQDYVLREADGRMRAAGLDRPVAQVRP